MQNLAGALALLEAAGIEQALHSAVVNAAMQRVTLAGRMQRVEADGDWLFDVAHNPAAAAALATALAAAPRPTVAIFGALKDKDVDAVIAALAAPVDRWIALRADSARALDAAEIAERIRRVSDAPVQVADSAAAAVDAARASGAERLLVTGSFFVVGPVQRAIGLYSGATQSR